MGTSAVPEDAGRCELNYSSVTNAYTSIPLLVTPTSKFLEVSIFLVYVMSDFVKLVLFSLVSKTTSPKIMYNSFCVIVKTNFFLYKYNTRYVSFNTMSLAFTP